MLLNRTSVNISAVVEAANPANALPIEGIGVMLPGAHSPSCGISMLQRLEFGLIMSGKLDGSRRSGAGSLLYRSRTSPLNLNSIGLTISRAAFDPKRTLEAQPMKVRSGSF
ncbi:hypothetical protein [Methylobacterium oryzisoli]|uniref:hypothetical protein n=1 Tax=Methylobacterium oryzisoli TaxID=3385502 RepID=UPI003891629E